MRKIKKIELRFRRKLARVPFTELFGCLAVYYLLIAWIHTSLDPYLGQAAGLLLHLAEQPSPVSWSEYNSGR